MMRNFATILLVIISLGLKGQNNLAPLEGSLTQYMFHQPFFNPSSMGSYETFTGAVYYQNQWSGITGAPNVQGLDLTIPIGVSNFLGTSVNRDDTGDGTFNRYQFYVNYAFKLKLTDEDFLSLGLSAGGEYNSYNSEILHGIDINDPALTQNNSDEFAPNMKLGAYYFREGLYVGAAMSNLFSSKTNINDGGWEVESFNWDDVTYLGHAGIRFPIGEFWDMDVSTLAQYRVGSKGFVDLNAQFLYDDIFGVGASYRTNNEFALMANFRLLDHFRLGYAYGTFFSDLGGDNTGSHELMLIYSLGDPKKTAVVIPRF